MMDFVATFQHWLTLACFVALAVCLFALAVLCAIPELTDAIRRFCGMDNFSKVVCGVCIVGAVLYGGSKGVNVRWDDGLRDNGTLITNDTVAVRWTYSGIPGASSVFIDYREAGTTNDWLNLAETLASAQEWTGTLANATNYDYWVYSTYVPPVPVHTNGVWVGQAYETKAKVGAAAFLILNGKVVADGRTIAPPKWAEPPPYDAEVEFLESTGTQYVDAGFKANTTATKLECLISPRNVTQTVGLCGSRNIADNANSTSCNIFIINRRMRLDWVDGYYTGSAMLSAEISVDSMYQLSFTRGLGIMNGTEYISRNTASVDQNYNFLIGSFVNGTRGAYAGFVGRWYWVKIYSNGELIRDFIPVRIGTTGAMYDKRGVGGMNPDGSPRNDGMYFNRGTGNFGYGNDK